MASERMTSISLPGCVGSGLADWGRKTPAEMIAQYRAYARHLREHADAVLAAPDDAFRVETYVGEYKRHRREVLQESAP
jgi:hypothetical protein